ncbi:acetyl-CoA carboxylase biotin carboxyl carrier protein [Pseudosporangium ferrugineum]|uniref:Biotin carboxyl carrier protein of acetyl-CoA carboxylase n=1 Tax=Pseudosporangium ferrugineum TaxID=439699 RepID=A0A2T0RX67_9ACTN|nr:acetyl-CoA carboxylase biotin carboxyl carrier protein [Pseudosporangium ferrugineum]PRY25786.1 acetyl-CoA carboxylase biotin carboxyl carrier protein [Pseudosporangium ferrugineum]
MSDTGRAALDAATTEEHRIALIRREALALISAAPARCTRVRLEVGDCVVEMSWEQPAVAPAAPVAPAAAVTVTATPAAPVTVVAEAAPADDSHSVTSPMVGTFYRAPEPGAHPFVEVGDRVEVGDPVGIVEAMKLMNQIVSDVAGVVVAVDVADADGVEFGQTLVRVKADGS